MEQQPRGENDSRAFPCYTCAHRTFLTRPIASAPGRCDILIVGRPFLCASLDEAGATDQALMSVAPPNFLQEALRLQHLPPSCSSMEYTLFPQMRDGYARPSGFFTLLEVMVWMYLYSFNGQEMALRILFRTRLTILRASNAIREYRQ